MGMFNFNKRVKHQQFDYKPRFFDPDKEALQERLKGYKTESSLDPTELSKQRIKSGLRSKSGYVEGYRQEQVKKSNSTLLITIAVLATISYLVLTSDKFLAVLNALLD